MNRKECEALTWSFGWYRTAAYALFRRAAANHCRAGKSLAENRFGQPSEAAKEAANGTRQSGSTAERRPKPKRARSIMPYGTKCLGQLTAHCTVHKTITLTQSEARVARQSAMRRIDRATFDPRKLAVSPKSPVMKIRPGSNASAAGSMRSNTGTWGGIWTKILYFLAALIGASLPLTGYGLWWRRLSNKKHRLFWRTLNLRQTINLSSTLMAAEDKFMQFEFLCTADMLFAVLSSLLFAFVRSSSAFASLTCVRYGWRFRCPFRGSSANGMQHSHVVLGG